MSSLTDQELRALVRESIARLRTPSPAVEQPLERPAAVATVHTSHVRFLLGPGGDESGACLIEPSVRCTHCGYCQSYGH